MTKKNDIKLATNSIKLDFLIDSSHEAKGERKEIIKRQDTANHQTAKHSSWIENFEKEDYKGTMKGNRTFNIKVGAVLSAGVLVLSISGLFILESVADAYFAKKQVDIEELMDKKDAEIIADMEKYFNQFDITIE